MNKNGTKKKETGASMILFPPKTCLSFLRALWRAASHTNKNEACPACRASSLPIFIIPKLFYTHAEKDACRRQQTTPKNLQRNCEPKSLDSMSKDDTRHRPSNTITIQSSQRDNVPISREPRKQKKSKIKSSVQAITYHARATLWRPQ